MVVAALLAVVYAISQTLWQPATVPLETSELEQAAPGVETDGDGASIPTEQGSRERLRRPASIPRTPGGLPASRRTPTEATGGRTRTQRPTSQFSNPREMRRPAGARVITTGPDEDSTGSEPVEEPPSASEKIADTLNLPGREPQDESPQRVQTAPRSRQGQAGASGRSQSEEARPDTRRQSPPPPPSRASNRH